jgi:hypothetical protein
VRVRIENLLPVNHHGLALAACLRRGREYSGRSVE